jgi:hemin uptake protein HemP
MPNPEPGTAPQKTISSTELLAGAQEITIAHNGTHYRLRLTKQDKLILTK